MMICEMEFVRQAVKLGKGVNELSKTMLCRLVSSDCLWLSPRLESNEIDRQLIDLIALHYLL